MNETNPRHRGGARSLAVTLALALTGCHPVKSLWVDIHTPGASYRPSAKLTCEGQGAVFTPDVGVLADAHLNNYYGAGLVMDSLAADEIIKVAARPSAVDLWSDVALSGFVREMTSALWNAKMTELRRLAPLLLFLGDAANVACTGEFDRFVETMQANLHGAAWLMVHGNHDSYMMGNFNRWGRPPGVYAYEGAAAFARREDDVIDAAALSDSEFTAAEGRMLAYRNATCAPGLLTSDQRSWAAACAEPTRESMPMCKGTWLRRYLAALEVQGARLELLASPAREPVTAALGGALDPSRCAPPRAIEGSAGEQTDLGRRHLWLTGKVYSRRRVATSVPCQVPRAELNSYRSYVVQSLDLSEKVRAVLLDTDHRRQGIGIDLTQPWAGQVGQMEEEQLADIARHVERARAGGQRVVFFGHHPLSDLPEGVRSRLLAFEPLAFVSAHTHAETSVVLQRVNQGQFVELSVGSTADWPMETMLLNLKESRLRWRVLGVREPSEVGAARGQARAWGYEKVPWAMGPSACEARFGPARDFTAYKHRLLSQRYHNLCLLRQELDEISPLWPGDRGPFRAIEKALGPMRPGGDALPPGKNFWPFADAIAASVEKLRSEAMREGSAGRAFALCQAMGASLSESRTHGWRDEEIQQADLLHPNGARPAGHYTGADL